MNNRPEEWGGEFHACLDSFFVSAPAGLALFDRDCRYLKVNETLANINGRTIAEHIGKRPSEILPADPALAIEKSLRQVLSTLRADPTSEVCSETTISQPGAKRHWRYSQFPVFNLDGDIEGVGVIVVETTEVIKAEERKLRYYRHIFSASQDLMSFVDRNYIYQCVNEAYCKAFAKKEEEIVGRSVADLLGEEAFHGLVKDYLDRALAGEQVSYGAWFDREAGRRFLSVAYAPDTKSDGEIEGVAVTVRDFTNYKISEMSLRNSEERFRSLVELAPHGVEECDLRGRITFCNPALEKLQGYNQGELLGMHIWDQQATEADRKGLQKYLQTLVRNQPQPQPFFTKNRRKDGRIIEVEVDWNYKRDSQGNLEGLITIITDVTDRNRTEKMLQDAHDNLGREVRLRTAELMVAMENMRTEITMHEKTAKLLRQNELELRSKSEELAESNIALKILLKKRDEERDEFVEQMQQNITSRLTPYLERLKKSRLREDQRNLVQLIESTIPELASSKRKGRSGKLAKLTPTETTVANLIKQAKTSKEIAKMLGISTWTVDTHRGNIRKKLGIKNKTQGLKKTLLSLP